MRSPHPVLYVFAISHYCEKARWALDHLRTQYELRYVAPGEHRQIAKKLGASTGSVPYLTVDGRLIQGSADIIDWADQEALAQGNELTLTVDSAAYAQIEKRFDDVMGVHVRRYYYSEAIVEHPELVRPVFTRNLPFSRKILITIAWKKIQGVMISAMDLGKQQGEESRVILDGELQWLDELLADGRSYLVGGRFSRADITAASLLAPLILPPQHPAYCNMQHPPRLAQEVAAWEGRPAMQWARNMYAKHR